MSARSLPRFMERVQLFLALVVLYLLVLQVPTLLGLMRGAARLEAALEAQLRTASESVVTALGRERLREAVAGWRTRGARVSLPLQRSFVELHGLLGVELLTPEGWSMDAAVRAPAARADDADWQLTALQRQRLAAGETLVDLESGTAGPPVYAVARAHVPVMDDRAGLAAVLALDMSAEPLALARRETRWLVGIEAGALVAFLGLLVFFARWMLQPLRLLDRTTRAEDPSAVAASAVAEDETGFVIDTYRTMIEQLREKEQELRRLKDVERHRADELQDLNASIVDSMVSGVILLDLSGRIRSCNDAARELFRLGDGRATGRPFRDVLAHLPELHARLQDCLDAGSVLRREDLRLSLAGVGRRDVGLTLSPLLDREGQRTGCICLAVDLTEVKKLQEQVRMRESLAELGELSAGIAHEFRNSLATILGHARLIEKGASGDARESAAAIHAEVGALRHVVDDFLRFANPTRLVIESVDLAAVLRDLQADVASRAGARRVAYAVGDGLPTVSGDDTLLRRVFTNLVRNAVDAVGDGGRIAVSAEPGDGEVTVHVDDDGPGLPPGDRERIFVPFFTRKELGTGLGLALARKIVVHHGGRIVADTAPMGGARFSVTLPHRPDRDLTKPTATVSPASVPGGER
jgi:PAS domain S-box-containing protein